MNAEHTALVARTLGITPDEWNQIVSHVARKGTVAERLASLTRAFAAVRPPVRAAGETRRCGVCDGACEPAVATATGLVYGRCNRCGHGELLGAGVGREAYGAAYYQHKDERGVGYAAYETERAYREKKGRALVERLISALGRPGRLLEVGSGYGFTRKAASDLGLPTAGVDLNPHAAEAAQRLYGFDTFTGTLEDALKKNLGVFDLVLYQFVLEHVASPREELAAAHDAARPGGLACFVVPSMEAAELDVFAGSYRSLRADHLWLFTRASLTRLLESAGFDVVSITSSCSLHLLADVLSHDELQALYEQGRGPDLTAIAKRRA